MSKRATETTTAATTRCRCARAAKQSTGSSRSCRLPESIRGRCCRLLLTERTAKPATRVTRCRRSPTATGCIGGRAISDCSGSRSIRTKRHECGAGRGCRLTKCTECALRRRLLLPETAERLRGGLLRLTESTRRLRGPEWRRGGCCCLRVAKAKCRLLIIVLLLLLLSKAAAAKHNIIIYFSATFLIGPKPARRTPEKRIKIAHKNSMENGRSTHDILDAYGGSTAPTSPTAATAATADAADQTGQLDKIRKLCGELEQALEMKNDECSTLTHDMHALSTKLIREIELRAAVQAERDRVQEEVEELTRALFEQANGMVADESRKRHEESRRRMKAETELGRVMSRLDVERQMGQSLRRKISDISLQQMRRKSSSQLSSAKS